jgi:hypothetical protein
MIFNENVFHKIPRFTVLNNQAKNSLQLFIENCCTLSRFEADKVYAQQFQEFYEQFCVINHLQIENIQENILKREYGIEVAFVPEEWIVRILEIHDANVSNEFYLDHKKIDIHLKLLTNQIEGIPQEDLN